MKLVYTIALGLFLLVYGCVIVFQFLASHLWPNWAYPSDRDLQNAVDDFVALKEKEDANVR